MRIAILLLAAATLEAEQCATFLPSLENSRCLQYSTQLTWTDRPEPLESIQLPAGFWEPGISDAALLRGVRVTGPAQFEFLAAGEHIVEVFAGVSGDSGAALTLLADGKALEVQTPGSRTPGLQPVSLVGVVRGPARLEIHSGSESWWLAGLRWTIRQEYELLVAPSFERRLAVRIRDPLPGSGAAMARQRIDYLSQLGQRLAASRNMRTFRSGLAAQAHAAFWQWLDDPSPARRERADGLLRRVVRSAPGDEMTRQLTAAVCRHLYAAASPLELPAAVCAEEPGLGWPAQESVPAAEAPEWAVWQRRWVERAENVATWWATQRLQLSGTFGAGPTADRNLLDQLALLALGAGSPVAWDILQTMRKQFPEAWAPAAETTAGESPPLEPDWVRFVELRAREAVQRLDAGFELYTRAVLLPEFLRFGPERTDAPYLVGTSEPPPAVSWDPSPASVARALRRLGEGSWEVALYNFQPDIVELTVRFWGLRDGVYRVSGLPEQMHRWEAGEGAGRALVLSLPPGREIRLRIEPRRL
jgi:hypothetical protein